jgi:hypothetical protein
VLSILYSSMTLMTPSLESSIILIEVFAFYECIFLSEQSTTEIANYVIEILANYVI